MGNKIDFYMKENGEIPVRLFLLSLSPKMRAKSVRDIELLGKFGDDLREPYVKTIKGKEYKGLYELRIKFASDIARIFYFSYRNGRYILLHGYVKKTIKAPKRELEIAKNRMKDYIRRSQNE